MLWKHVKLKLQKNQCKHQIQARTSLSLHNVRSEHLVNKESDVNDNGQAGNSNAAIIIVDETSDKRNKRSIAILSDSMLKDVEAFKMREALGGNDKIYIKTFSGATVHDMEYYIKPSLRYKNNLLIIHTGTNSLRTATGAEDIANEIVNLAKSMKNESNEIMISGIILRRDRFDMKGLKVNDFLKTLCIVNNIHLINHFNISSVRHLNAGGLHLNINGTYQVADNLLNATKL